jgi:hypothetical protein
MTTTAAVLNLDRVADLVRRSDIFAEAWRLTIDDRTSVGYVLARGPDGSVAYGCGVYTGSDAAVSAFVDDFACCPGNLFDDYDGDYETATTELEAARHLVRLVTCRERIRDAKEAG